MRIRPRGRSGAPWRLFVAMKKPGALRRLLMAMTSKGAGAGLTGSCDSATARVRSLLAAPIATWDESSKVEFGEQLPRASFHGLDRAPVGGSCGLPCLRLSLSEP